MVRLVADEHATAARGSGPQGSEVIGLAPAHTALSTAVGCPAAGRAYGARFGWRCRVVGTTVLLRLSGGLVAVVVDVRSATRVHWNLLRGQLHAPLLLLPGEQRQAVFIADSCGQPLVRSAVPSGCALLTAPAEIPLPPSVVVGGQVRWIAAPDPNQNGLPSVNALLSAISRALDTRPPG
jgi:hypothetical protein